MWLFKKRSPSPSSYEKVLDKIAANIRKSESRILSLRASHRRVTGLLTLYSLLFYGIFLTYAALAQKFTNPPVLLSAIGAPPVIWLARRGIFEVFSRRIKRQETTLQALRGDQKTKVEELKSSTKYYTTKSLLDRFESKNGSSGPGKENTVDKNDRRGPVQQGQSDSSVSAVDDARPNSMLSQQQQSSSQPLQWYGARAVPQPPQPPMWYDRILDLLVGEDETDPRNRYALICFRCGTHNGLAPPGQAPDSVRYICPVCGQWNPEEAPSITAEGDEKPETTEERSETTIKDDEKEESPVKEADEVLIENRPPIRQQPNLRARVVRAVS
ncbi:hypothetical protein V1525DRAFT_433946 [Lipomyces kononenkoae]|uniref:Uncharacterized protein n=1 Tax=Lipomyces kononenkoae TaxID=34357 RepID=A0ACC3SZJ9_LIPKO